MITKRSYWIPTLALLLFAASATALAKQPSCTGNDAADWRAAGSTSVSVQGVSSDGSVPGGTASLGVIMTSPSCLNSYSTFPNLPDGLSLYTDVKLDSSTCPDGTSGSAQTCILAEPVATITNNPQTYTDFSQDRTYAVAFDASKALPGTYTYHVHANANDGDASGDNSVANGYGWGYGGGRILTVGVHVRTAAGNTTPRLVTIQKPTGYAAFCSGGTTLPIEFSASGNNQIASVSATVNTSPVTLTLDTTLPAYNVGATGSYAPTHVGEYTVEATAVDVCSLSTSADTTVGVVYSIAQLQPPLANGSKAKGGSDAPIKFIPRDCAGNLVSEDTSAEVKVWLGSTLEQDSTYTGCTGPQCGMGASTLVRYDATTGAYITNFQTLSGVNTYKIELWFGGYKNASFTLSTTK